MSPLSFERTQSVAVLGGGPGGYEAALAAAQQGAEVTLVERAGVGGSAVITDVVPSKSLIATADAAVAISEASDLGVQLFEQLGNEQLVGYAQEHLAVIRKFGRFPFRNAALGRESTAEELAHIAEFGERKF